MNSSSLFIYFTLSETHYHDR